MTDETDAFFDRVEDHYSVPDLWNTILERLVREGIPPAQVTRSDIAGVDEFHVRGAAVSREMVQSLDLHGMAVLDIGCGLGGPCRMLAEEFDCQVTGVDLNKGYVETAIQLSKLVGLDARTTFLQANALDLPFKDATFDAVWTQHVQMNISNKRQFYREMDRVLRPGGHLLYYDIFQGNTAKPQYPMPWADTADLSFLFSKTELSDILQELGLERRKTTDQTEAGIRFFEGMMTKLGSGPPNIGLHLLMGKETASKIGNLLQGLKTGALILESGLYGKPASEKR